MKKNLLIIAAAMLLASCGNNKGYAIVTFDLNYDTENDIYLNQVVQNNQKLIEPAEPNRPDYVFEGWFLDKECKKPFNGFDKEANKDLVLYAAWSDYEDLEDHQKIDKFLEKIETLTGKVSNASVVQEGVEAYYTPVEQAFPYYQEIEYARYKDITVADYYDSGATEKFATQQFFYDDEKMYNIYQDLEGNQANSSRREAKFSEDKIESHLNIDFLNIYGSHFTYVSSILKKGTTSSSELGYDFTLNYTQMDPTKSNYSFEFNYYTYIENESFGFAEEVYMFDISFSFVDGKIKRSNVGMQYMFGIEGEVQMLIEENKRTSYKYVDEYENFSGEKLNPSDFKLAN